MKNYNVDELYLAIVAPATGDYNSSEIKLIKEEKEKRVVKQRKNKYVDILTGEEYQFFRNVDIKYLRKNLDKKYAIRVINLNKIIQNKKISLENIRKLNLYMTNKSKEINDVRTDDIVLNRIQEIKLKTNFLDGDEKTKILRELKKIGCFYVSEMVMPSIDEKPMALKRDLQYVCLSLLENVEFKIYSKQRELIKR